MTHGYSLGIIMIVLTVQVVAEKKIAKYFQIATPNKLCSDIIIKNSLRDKYESY